MFEGKYGKALTIGLVAVIIIIVGVFAYFTIDFIIKSNDRKEAQDAAERLENELNSSKKNKIAVNEEAVDINIQSENLKWKEVDITNDKMYKGFKMVGTIQIPKTNLNLPVLASVSKASIEASVAVRSGPGLNKVGNTVIYGHNYKDARFFSDNKNLSNGDKVYITDLSGTKLSYTIYNIYTTTAEDSDYISRNTEGRKEITLLTCTDDAVNRLVIFAKED